MPNPENLKGKGFESRPGNINRKGRPKSSWKNLYDAMSKEGNEPLTRKEYIKYFTMIASMTEKQIREMQSDKDLPYAVRFLAMEFENKKTRSKMFMEYMDVAFKQDQQQPIHYSVDVTLEEAKKLAKELEDEM